MSNNAQYYEGQIRILNILIIEIEKLIHQTELFSTIYKDQIDKAYNNGMMMEYIEPLRNKGYPIYKEKIQRSKEQLIRMKNKLEGFINVLERLKQQAISNERNLV